MSDQPVDLEEYRGLREALVAGKLATHPALIRFGARIADEGGADASGWA